MIDKEANSLLLRLATSSSTLREAIEDKDREEVSRVVQEITVLSMRLVGRAPGLDQIGAKHLTAEEVSQLKKDLSSLMSQ